MANLKRQNLLTLFEYIKSTFDISLNLKIENGIKEYKESNISTENEGYSKSYEDLLKKEEKSLREHISSENQLKLYIEGLLDEQETLKKKNKKLLYKIVILLLI